MKNKNSDKALTVSPGKQARKTSPMHQDSPLIAIQTRNDFVKNATPMLLISAIVVVLGLFAQIFVAYIGFSAKSERVYIATDNTGFLLKLYKLDEPNHTPLAVSQFVTNAVVDSMSMNFVDMQNRLNSATMRWFTKQGATEFLNEFNKAGYSEAISTKELILNTVLEHTPVMVSDPAVNPKTNVYTWIFQADGLMTFRTKGKEVSKKIRMTIWVEQRSLKDSKEGLGIAKLIITNR